MPAERWQQVERLYHAVLEHRPEARADFLARACHGDAALRGEVESLLRYANETTGFLEPSAFGAALTDLAEAPGQLAGKRVGGYEVSALLGAGGMGEVYRARELRLGRDVALKILAPSLAGSAGDVRRFEEEARSACVLNHPNIVTIYGVGEANGVAYIAMELVDGRTLRQLIGGQMLPVRTALDLAAQLTEALAAAHDRGIVHRDLKPDNIMVTPDGRVKVLDFGIAKRDNAFDATERVTRGSASQEPLTEDGAILGTVGYMSPEQATGRLALPQSDQFSFGLIFYEMLSGRRAFERPTRADTLVAIIRDEPVPLQHLGPHDVALKKIVDRCLKKDPGARYATTRALDADVRTIRETMMAAERSPAMTRRHAIWLGVGASAAAIAGVVTWRAWPSERPRRLAILPFANPLNDNGTDYLCDGLTRTLIDQLSKVSTLSVIAEATAFALKGRHFDPRAIGQMLGVDAILSGDVSRQLERAQINAELIDARTGDRLWKQAYDRAEIDMLMVESAIAEDIITDGLALKESERRQLPPPPTDNREAFKTYLEARHMAYDQTENNLRAAIPLFQAVVALDPKFAEAIAALANMQTGLIVDGWERPRDAWPEQQRWADRALTVDSGLPEALMEKSTYTFFYEWKFDEAERNWAELLNSPRGLGVHNLLYALVVMRWALRRKNAIQTAHTLALTDPLSPVRTTEADFELLSGRVDRAAALYETIIRDVPNDSRAYYGLAEARRQQRKFSEAIRFRRAAVQMDAGGRLPSDDPLGLLFETAQGEDGLREIDHACARLNIKSLNDRKAAGFYASALDYAHAYATLGEIDRAFRHLDVAIEEKEAGCAFLNVDVGLIPLRSHPRFARAVKEVGLP
jgi:serine/threonine protein kinase